MKADVIIDQETQKVKLIFDWSAGKIGERWTVDEAENVVKLIETTVKMPAARRSKPG